MDSEGVGKADEDIKVYKKYREGELKGWKTRKVLREHVFSLYSSGISQLFGIRDIKKLQ